MANQSIVIIGAGIAGLSAGCYAQMNDYRIRIFEMHDKPGGLCSLWKRLMHLSDGLRLVARTMSLAGFAHQVVVQFPGRHHDAHRVGPDPSGPGGLLHDRPVGRSWWVARGGDVRPQGRADALSPRSAPLWNHGTAGFDAR